MYAALTLEWLGGERRASLLRALGRQTERPWVAQLSVISGRLQREFLPQRVEEGRLECCGLRGFRLWYVLADGGCYEVNAYCSVRHQERYYCQVQGGALVRCPEKRL